MKRIVLGALLSSVAAFALQVHPIPVELEQGKKYKEFTIADDNGKYQVYLKKMDSRCKRARGARGHRCSGCISKSFTSSEKDKGI